MSDLPKEIYTMTKKIYSKDNPNYKKGLAYKLLNCAKCGDVNSFLDIVLRSLCARENTDRLVNLLNQCLFDKKMNKKEVMYSFIMGLIG